MKLRKSVLNAKVQIELLTESKGGKSSPIFSGYRPNHNFRGEENRSMYVGEVLFDLPNGLKPGETKAVTVRFLWVPQLEADLTSGKRWRIQEGAKLVGYAQLISIDSSE